MSFHTQLIQFFRTLQSVPTLQCMPRRSGRFSFPVSIFSENPDIQAPLHEVLSSHVLQLQDQYQQLHSLLS
jgi:hypothetical protein